MIYQSSRILQLHVDENDVVRKGSPLFTVEDSNEAFLNMESSRAQLRQQISALKSSEAKMLSSRSLRDFYKDQSLRYSFLAKTRAATSEQADEKNTLFKATEQEYISNLELVKANKAALDSIGWQYRTNRFKSVISTVRAQSNLKVFKIYSRAGESIQNGKHVMDVGESQSMGVLAEVHRIDIKNIKLNQSALVTVNGIPGIKWTGKVIKIASQVTQQSINSDDSAAIIANRVFEVLIKLSPASSLDAQKYNYMEVNVLFGQ
jgi:multidrug resistance efflux pump